jgi:vitamin B12 transporter
MDISFFLRTGKPLLGLILFLCLLFPVYSDEETGVDESYNDFFIMEDEGLTITGTLETTQQIRTLTKEAIEQTRASDLPSLLEQTLDLPITRRGPYGNETEINLRGFDTERIAILIDGVPANSPLSGDFDFSTISIDSIEKIEIIYGGSDTKYNVSGALGGVINIITVKKQRTGLNLGGGVSTTGYMPGKYAGGEPHYEDLADTQSLNFFAGYGAEHFSWKLNWFGNHAMNHYVYKDNLGYARREHNEILDTGADAAIVRDLPDMSKLIVKGGVYYGDKNYPVASASNIFGVQEDFSASQSIMLDMPRIFHDNLATEVTLNNTWSVLGYEEADTDSLHRMDTVQAINRWALYPFAALTMRAGWDFRYIYLDSTDIGFKDRQDGGIYFTTEFKPVEKFLVVASIKTVFNNSDSSVEAAPVPKIGFLWNVNEYFTLKNNYFRSFKFPDFNDLYWNQPGYYGNPNLKNEDGWGADLGAGYQYEEWIKIDTTLSAQWTKDSIHWDNTKSGVWRPENVGEAAFFGWDSKARSEIPVSFGAVEKIIFSFSYHYLLSYILTGDNTFASEVRMPYMPMHTLGLSMEFLWKTGSFLVSGHFESSRHTSADDSKKSLDPYFLFNANFNQKIGANVSFFAVLKNILNISYQSLVDYPMPGISATLGIRFNIEPGQENPDE